MMTNCDFLKLSQNHVNLVAVSLFTKVTDTSMTSHAPGGGRGKNVGLKDFAFQTSGTIPCICSTR